MNISVHPLIGMTISNLISATYGPILGIKDSDVLDYCQRMGEVYVGYIDDHMICAWGLVPPSFLSMHAYLWMWCVNEQVDHPFVFIRQSQIHIRRMLERYEVINGHCIVGSKAIRWLKWLGAEFADYPVEDHIAFVIRRKVNG